MKRAAFLGLCLALAATFAALGVWQLERLHWKTGLIARVETRIAAPPRAAPSPAEWSPELAYTKVRARGVLLHERETLVLAVTELGPGFWVLTPLQTEGGFILINRGFVPSERRDASRRTAGQTDGEVIVTGLMRASEPRGGFLRTNAPEQGRWYSRDVEAIARAMQLSEVAPYFIDADAAANPGGFPVGGLTVVTFRNSHLAYAITWFVLASFGLGAAILIHVRRELQTHQRPGKSLATK